MQMLVFRDAAGRSRRTSHDLLCGLVEALRKHDVLDAFLRAGEIECSLADAGQDLSFRSITDAIALALIHPERAPYQMTCAIRLLQDCGGLPHQLEVKAPEGFCYYGLHPLRYAISGKGKSAAVIGIRSIGTTLSAVAAGALGAERITVRPTGHPYHRQTVLSPAQELWVRKHIRASAEFYVVDEGPGLSGSSFLSVGEALERAGVPRTDIVFVCSHEVDPQRLVTDDAVERWGRFQTQVVPQFATGPEGAVGWPDWRSTLLPDRNQWPGVWMQMSLPRLISEDRKWIYKFEGFSRYGDEVRRRSERLMEAGFGPRVIDAGDGWSGYELLAGPVPRVAELTPTMIRRMAEYVAWRATAFATDTAEIRTLEEMARFNARQLWGEELPNDFVLPARRAAIVDAKMMPYEWRQHAGALHKLDAASHGDSHFFPGPVDIAWDLAGSIVEWEMDESASAALLEEYRRESGDPAEERIANYIFAYCAFQAGYARMASAAMAATDEQEVNRLERDVERYTKFRNKIRRSSSPPLLVQPA